MSLTVADCLKLPSLRESSVVSGHKGLNKIVNSISVLELVDSDMLSNRQLFTPNELLLTAFTSIKDDVNAQCHTIEMLYESGDVGIVLYYVGHFLPEINEKLIAKSNELSLPLIAMPYNRMDLGYNDVISDVMEAVFLNHQKESRYVNQMLERISQLPKHQRTLGNVIQMMSIHLKSSLLLTDTSSRCICFVKWPVTSPIDAEALLSPFQASDHSRDTEDAILLLSLPGESKMKAYCIPFTDVPYRHLRLLALDTMGTLSKNSLFQAVELLQLFSSIWKCNIDSMQLDALIPAILGDSPDRVYNIAQAFHLDIASINTMLLVNLKDETQSLVQNQHRLEHLAKIARNELRILERPAIADVYNKLLVIFLSYSTVSKNDLNIRHTLMESIFEVEPEASFTIFTNLEDTLHVQKMFLLYTEFYQYATQIYPLRKLFTTYELIFARECRKLQMESRERTEENILECLNPLFKESDGTDLLQTLAVYWLDADSDTKKTGELMFLHRNTIQYRLNKIKKILNYDITHMPEAYMVYRAIGIYRMMALLS